MIARFVPELNAIRKLLERRGIRYALITGEVKNREEQVSLFQNNADVPVFVGQIATAGLGITLTAASTMVFYSLDYSMSNFEQTKARIHRVGQRDTGMIFDYLTASLWTNTDVIKVAHDLLIDFALEAKRYEIDIAVKVENTSRLISRLRFRQFGVLITTSYLHHQAYKELKEDGHPILVICAKDIVTILRRIGITTVDDVKKWLDKNFQSTNGDEQDRLNNGNSAQ